MFAITVTEKGGEQRRLEFDKAEVTIGRVQGNDVILPKGNVSKRHARIVLKDGKFIIVDLKSTNGTYVNGRKITSPLVVKETDKIYIGDFILGVDEEAAQAVATPGPSAVDPRATSGGSYTGARPGPSSPPPLADAPSSPALPSPPMSPSPAPPVASPSPPVSPPRPQGAHSTLPPPAPSSVTAPKSPSRPAPRQSSSPPPAPQPSAPSGPAAATPQPMPSPAPTPDPGLRQAPPPASTTGAGASLKPRLVGAGASAVRRARPQTSGPRRAPVVAPLDPKVIKLLELQRSILDQVLPKLGIDNVALDRLGDEELWQRAETAIVDLVESMDSAGDIPKFIDQDQLIKETLNEALGLGPLEDLLADAAIEEIVVDRRDRILVGRDGQLSGAGTGFSSDEIFRRVVERLAAPSGHKIGDGRPFVDVRLRDGSRLAAAVPPVAVRGACLTLRKPRTSSFDLGALIEAGALSGEMADFLSTCVQARKNILVCGAPSSGKSVVLAALASAAPEGERIVSVEEVSELALDRDDWIALESRPGDGNGVADVSLETLLRGALRMRPDRLVVGDVRGEEAFELVQAMASSCDGALASLTGDGAKPALARLTAMARLAAPGSSAESVRELVALAADIVVHVARYADGVFRIAAIDEVLGVGEDGFETRELFSFRGRDESFGAAGIIPDFYAELESRGIPADTSIFRT